MEDFRRQFLTEAAENLRALAADWRGAAQPNYDSVRRDSFRALHTIKGTAQTFGYESASRLAHELENLLSVVKTDESADSENSKTLFLEGIELLIESLEKENFEIPRRFGEKVQNLIPKTAAPQAKQAESSTFGIPTEFFAQLSAQEKNAIRAAAENEKTVFCFEVGFEAANFAEQLISFREILFAAGEIIATLPGAKSSAGGKIGFQILFASSVEMPKIEAIAEAGAAQIIFNSASPEDQKAEKVFSNDARGVLAQIVEHGEQTARKLGKEIFFETSHSETRLSPANLKLVFDSLLHLVRNAVDHAVETNGRIEIRLTADANGLRLIVSDDGRGIDAEAVRVKAVEKNLISADRILTEQQKLDLIFLPELTTKTRATEISGRGVGLDAVKFAIEKAGGEISVRSRIGKGTVFEIVLPPEENETPESRTV